MMVDEREETFRARIERGDVVDAGDWMPEEYRRGVLKLLEMHANSEIMGALPEREWIRRAPTVRRQMPLTAKAPDEVGHSQLLYSAAAGLGKSREPMSEAAIAGKTM